MIKSRRELCGATTLALLLAGASPGCNNKDRSVPPGPPALPAMSAGAGAGNAGNVHGPGPQQVNMPGDHPQALHGRSEQPDPAVAAREIIRGSLNLADTVKAKVPAGGTIFLIARAVSPTGGPGPVLAAKRLTVGAWPQPFELSGNDVMLSGTSLQGRVILGARVDQDGDAMTKQAGDVEGISSPVDVPANGVVILLDKLRTESAGAPSPPNMGGMGGGMGGGAMPPGHPPTELPAGHPAIGTDAPSGPAASAPAPTGAAPSLPAGHPPMGKPAGHPPVAKPAKPAGHP